METNTKFVGTRIMPKIKEAIEKQIPDRWPSTSAFVLEAITEKLKKENIEV